MVHSPQMDSKRRRISYGKSSIIALAGLSIAALFAAPPPSPILSLQVVSATLNPSTHDIEVVLNNSSEKTIVGYIVETKGFDASGKQVLDSGTGWDHVSPDSNPQEIAQQILPGQTGSAISLRAPEQVVSIQVQVTGVLYQDRKFEGQVTPIFMDRARQAKAARQALTVLQQSAGHLRIQDLLTIDEPVVTAALTKNLNLHAVPDKNHPPVAQSFSKQQWEDVAADLTQKAAFLETQSQGVQ